MPNETAQFLLKAHSKHRTDNVLSFWEEKRKRQTWINKPDLKCSISLCSCTNSHSTDSYPRIKFTTFYQQGLIVLCKRGKSLIDHNIPLNINYSEQHYFNLHKYYTGSVLEKYSFFFFFKHYYCFSDCIPKQSDSSNIFPSSGSKNRETIEWAEIMLVGKTYGGFKLFFQLKTQVYPKTGVLHQILASGQIPAGKIY